MKTITSHINIAGKKLVRMPQNPDGTWLFAGVHVKGSFICSRNHITSLVGSPQIVNGDFHCALNQLNSLEGAPEIVHGDFSCSRNKIESLIGCPREVRGSFYLYHNDGRIFTEQEIKALCKVGGAIVVY